MMKQLMWRFRGVVLLALVLLLAGGVYGQIPDKPNPPRLVNDMAGMMSRGEQDQLERKLLDFERETSNQVTIVTVQSLGDYDVADYAVKLGKKWGVGKSGRNNGVVIIASLQDHKINISTGKGLEGALTDLTSGRIIRSEIVPAFKEKQFYRGFDKATDAVIAATKGEYKADPKQENGGSKRHSSGTAIIIFIIIIVFIIMMRGGGGGGGGRRGRYMSGGGLGDFATGMIIGNLLGGGGRSSGGGGGGSDSGGGFGGFGGGDFGGGGASGSW